MGKSFYSSILVIIGTALLLFSCKSVPAERPDPGVAKTVPEISVQPDPPAEAPLRPQSPEFIMGTGKVSTEKLVIFLARHNPEVDRSFIQELAVFYLEEADAEGVNHDIAFAQMCLETGFLGYGGLVTPEMNNFCGLGAIGPGQRGAAFPDPRTGVRAHIQHLKAYASEEPLNQAVVDPRYRWVRYGSAPTIHDLSGKWAADLAYSEKIMSILWRLYDLSFNG
ncbi:MAG: glucosaminidase domain-containing protein [Treponema sp.]|jgi:hypothetical protein|nr:glucosaminidase domain-containing protein [Treponema sp.]